MKKFFSSLAMAALVTVAAASSATAGLIQEIDTTLGAWKAAGLQTIGDKTFTFGSSAGIDDGDGVKFIELSDNTYLFNVVDLGNNAMGTIALDYSVTVNQVGYSIDQVGLNADIQDGGAGTNVTKNYTDEHGATYQLAITPVSGRQTLNVPSVHQLHVSITTAGDGTLFSISDSYHQSPVPEPSTFALLGLGGLGFAVRAIRRRKVAA